MLTLLSKEVVFTSHGVLSSDSV